MEDRADPAGASGQLQGRGRTRWGRAGCGGDSGFAGAGVGFLCVRMSGPRGRHLQRGAHNADGPTQGPAEPPSPPLPQPARLPAARADLAGGATPGDRDGGAHRGAPDSLPRLRPPRLPHPGLIVFTGGLLGGGREGGEAEWESSFLSRVPRLGQQGSGRRAQGSFELFRSFPGQSFCNLRTWIYINNIYKRGQGLK